VSGRLLDPGRGHLALVQERDHRRPLEVVEMSCESGDFLMFDEMRGSLTIDDADTSPVSTIALTRREAFALARHLTHYVIRRSNSGAA
jgi:hypothetical protein